jgi:hypothetical protein
MIEQIQHLNQEEQELVLQAPLYVSLLIAGADGDFNSEEKKRIVQLVHTKTFSERYELRELYRSLADDVEVQLRQMIAGLPDDTEERQQLLSDLLARLNPVFPKLEKTFARNLYKSLRQFAHFVANAEGGFWKISAVNQAEREWINLPMLQEPGVADEI